MSNGTRTGTLQMVTAMTLSGTIGLVVVESGQAPPVVALFRCLVGGAALLAWLAWRRGFQPIDRRQFGWLALAGAALLANWLCLFAAYRHSSISVATVIYHTQPFMLLLLAALLRREPIDLSKLPWLGLALAGVVLTSGLDAGEFVLHGGAALKGSAATGAALAAGAALLYAIATLATQNVKTLPPAQTASIQMLVGAVLVAPLAWPLLPQLLQPADGHRATAVAALLTIGLVHTALMYTLMYAAYQRLATSAIASLAFVYPAVALLVDLVWYQAWPQPGQALGIVLIVAALIGHRRTPAARAFPSSQPKEN